LIQQHANNLFIFISLYITAAPWTLMYYLLGGSSKKNQEVASGWLKEHKAESKQIMDLLTDIVIDYLSAQAENGADILQVFEAMGMFISEADFYEWALPSMTRIAQELKARHPDIPLLVFPRGASYAIVALQQAGYDVVTLDTLADRSGSRTLLEEDAAKLGTKSAGVQGNLDVAILEGLKYKKEGSAAETIEERIELVKSETRRMLIELGPQKLIANLGEGLTGKEDPVLVNAFIEATHSISETLIGEKVSSSP
jgi:uroporphyrinogen decarboxylase